MLPTPLSKWNSLFEFKLSNLANMSIILEDSCCRLHTLAEDGPIPVVVVTLFEVGSVETGSGDYRQTPADDVDNTTNGFEVNQDEPTCNLIDA